VDAYGRTRGADGTWDIGAYEYGGTAPTVTCGDGTCNGTETCSACAADCGACSCTPNWTCTAWSACVNNTQTRTCTDSNNCGTTAGKPAENQSCNVTGTFVVGDRVKVIVDPSLRVRSSAGVSDATILGTQPVGALGTIIAGPTSLDNYTWWNVNFDSAPDGWVIEKSGTTPYIEKVSATAKTGDLNSDSKVDVIDLGIFLGNWGATTKPASDLNQDGKVDVTDLGILLGNWG
jgi:hypothetical protein